MRLKYTKDLLQRLCQESFSIAEVLRKLNLKPIGGNYRTINKYIQLYDLNIEHFTGKVWSKGMCLKNSKDYTSQEAVKSSFLKKVEYKCAMQGCLVKDIWNGIAIVLHLDHIDGNNFNNNFENLRLLCPNCHSQTKTYCRQKSK